MTKRNLQLDNQIANLSGELRARAGEVGTLTKQLQKAQVAVREIVRELGNRKVEQADHTRCLLNQQKLKGKLQRWKAVISAMEAHPFQRWDSGTLSSTAPAVADAVPV